jgi:hypothetical protein
VCAGVGLCVLALPACESSLGGRDDGDSGVRTREAGTSDAGAVDSGALRDAGPPDSGGPACTGATEASSALAFDGVNDQVSMGRASELGLAELTVEAWVRRDGPGVATGTGVGGLSLVPIAGKGRGEGDGSNIDCNYQFGFFGDVLGADFEDMASGANHPVVGHTAVGIGEWHHVAATYDGTTWRLYLDGALDGQARASATPRADSIQHFGIGTAFDSMGRAAGRLHGAVDEVRVWDRARTAAEIAASMNTEIETDVGLVGRWALDEEDGGAPDTAGGIDGTITGATFVHPGASVGLDVPTLTALPEDDAEITGASTELSVAIEDADTDRFAVTFHVRELTEADDFTVVVLPDTQYYTVEGRHNEHHFYAQTRWIMDNREAYRIVAVIHNGDVVDHGDRYPYEWTIADRAMTTIEAAVPGLPDGMPYAIDVGNHDQTPNGTAGNTDSFNANFGVDRFAGRAYYGGHYGSTNDESWVTFSAGGLDFVVVSLQYDTTQDPAVTAWARRIFESHPNAFGILNSHYILTSGGNFGPQGQAIYDSLRDVQSLQLMTCGHVAAESRRHDTFEGHTIHSMLADYQGRDEGGFGWMRIWEFSPANDELTVRTYSPSRDEWETDGGSEYTIPVDLAGAGGDFRALPAIDPATHDARATFDGLEAGHTYEWYAVVSDCAHETRTPVRRFTTR